MSGPRSEAGGRAVPPRFAVCLHGAAVVARTDRLHEGDEALLRTLIARFPGADLAVVELCAAPGSGPGAVRTALALGAREAVRVVDAALATTDPHAAAQAWRAVLTRVAALRPLSLVLVAASADPEGACVASAPLARALAIPHLAQVEDIAPSGDPTGKTPFVARLRTAGQLFDLPVASGVVATCAPGAPAASPEPLPDMTPPAHRLEILSLTELGIPAALIRRSHDLAGDLRPFARSFVRCSDLGSLTAALRGSSR